VLNDRHLLWLDAIRSVLQRVDVEVVGAASDPETTLELVRRLQPDLLVAEGSRAGPALLGAAHAAVPELRSIVVSDVDDPAAIHAAFTAGARAYVLKHAHPDDLATAIRQAFTHSIFMAARTGGPVVPSPRDADVLTRREREILQLVALGHSNGDVASLLWVTPQTVKFHLVNVYRKIGVANRTEAGRWAHARGLVADRAPSLAA
jgi:NarL family two-component system response regulator LiaR